MANPARLQDAYHYLLHVYGKESVAVDYTALARTVKGRDKLLTMARAAIRDAGYAPPKSSADTQEGKADTLLDALKGWARELGRDLATWEPVGPVAPVAPSLVVDESRLTLHQRAVLAVVRCGLDQAMPSSAFGDVNERRAARELIRRGILVEVSSSDKAWLHATLARGVTVVPGAAAEWHVLSDEGGTILAVYGAKLREHAEACAQEVATSVGARLALHAIVGPRPSVGGSISMRGEIRYVDPVVRAAASPAPLAAPAGRCMSEVRGQLAAVAAVERAASTRQHVLLIGSPGLGRTMIARRAPGILPDGEGAPFRAPHHTVSAAGLVGDKRRPGGEAALAAGGVLMLDDLPEFDRSAINALADALRLRPAVARPALIIATAMPCPCGWQGSGVRSCGCIGDAIARYAARRDQYAAALGITERGEMLPVNLADPDAPRPDPSVVIRERVAAAWAAAPAASDGMAHYCVVRPVGGDLSDTWARQIHQVPGTTGLTDRAIDETESDLVRDVAIFDEGTEYEVFVVRAHDAEQARHYRLDRPRKRGIVTAIARVDEEAVAPTPEPAIWCDYATERENAVLDAVDTLSPAEAQTESGRAWIADQVATRTAGMTPCGTCEGCRPPPAPWEGPTPAPPAPSYRYPAGPRLPTRADLGPGDSFRYFRTDADRVVVTADGADRWPDGKNGRPEPAFTVHDVVRANAYEADIPLDTEKKSTTGE